jgi:hypothetical protein
MYDPNDEAYLAKLSGSPLAAPDDAYSANLQAYLAAQNALPRQVVEGDPSQSAAYRALIGTGLMPQNGDSIPTPTPVAEIATPAVKKAVKKLKKAVTADARDLGAVPATVSIPATNPQGVILPPAIAGSAAGLAMQGKTGPGHDPSWSSMVPQFLKDIFRSSVTENANKATWGGGALKNFRPENRNGPLSRTPFP